jgi:hypothetical protein
MLRDLPYIFELLKSFHITRGKGKHIIFSLTLAAVATGWMYWGAKGKLGQFIIIFSTHQYAR